MSENVVQGVAADYKSKLHQVSLQQRAASQARWANRDRFGGWVPPAELLQGGAGVLQGELASQTTSLNHRAEESRQQQPFQSQHQHQPRSLQGDPAALTAGYPGWAWNSGNAWSPEFGFSSEGQTPTTVAHIHHVGAKVDTTPLSTSAAQGDNSSWVTGGYIPPPPGV